MYCDRSGSRLHGADQAIGIEFVHPENQTKGCMALRLVPLLMLSLVACRAARTDEGSGTVLERLARQAKAEGKSVITTSFIPERDTHSTLEDVLRHASILIASSVGTSRVGVSDRIFTAQDFRVESWLRRASSDCGERWGGVTDDQNLVSLRVYKGTVVIDGISITEVTQDVVDFPAGNRYLLLVQDCGDRRIDQKYWSNSVFDVSTDGRISIPRFNMAMVPFVNEIVQIGTITALEQMLKVVPANRD